MHGLYFIGQHDKSVRHLPALDTKYIFWGKGFMHVISVSTVNWSTVNSVVDFSILLTVVYTAR